MKRIKPYAAFLLILSLVLPLFCGCSSDTALNDSELWIVTEQGTWDRMNGQIYVLEQAYKNEHPGIEIRVEYLPTNQQEREVYLQQLRTDILQGGGPDLYLLPTDNSLILDEPEQYTFIDVDPLFTDVDLAMRNGLFYDISDFYDADEALGKEFLNTDIMDAGVVDGKRYVLPLRYDLPVIYARHDALDAAGIDPAIMTQDIISIMEAVIGSGDPLLAMGLCHDGIDAFSDFIDYNSGNAILDEARLSLYMETYQKLKATIGTAYVDNHWTGDEDLFWELIGDGAISAEKLNVEKYLRIYYEQGLVEYFPLYVGTMQDAFDYAPIARYEEAEITITPMRSVEGEIIATVAYYGALGSGCRNPELAYDFLRLFLLEESQWEFNRPTVNHTKPLKGSGNTTNDLQYAGLIENGWPVRDVASLDRLWTVRRKQFYVAYVDSYFHEDKNIVAERNRRNRRIGRMGELGEELVPLFDVTIDDVRFNTTLSDEFSDTLAQLNDVLNEPTQANMDELARQYIWNLRWHVSEG